MTDYDAAGSSAALFDTASAAKLVLTGPDAPLFLHNLSTNDIKSLPLGGGCAAFFCSPTAKVQFQAWIYHIKLSDGRHAMWVETTPGRNEALVQYLDRYLISEQVEISDRTEEFTQFHLAGPESKRILENSLSDAIPELPEYAHMERTFGSTATCSIRRRDWLGLPGYDIVCLKDVGEGVQELLVSAGAIPGSPHTFDVLRIEAGTPLFGPDIDSNRFVMEVGGAGSAVSYSKGCYLGQEPIVMARDRAGHVNRAFKKMRVLEGGPLPPGAKLFREGQEVGQATSSCQSPRQGVIALGYLRWKHQDAGLKLEAETKQAVEVAGS